MDKKNRLPHEGAAKRDDGTEIHRGDDPTDTEGHRFSNIPPGTGGDLSPRRPSSGGELIDDNDVEGHGASNSLPGTGGDFSPRQPRSGGEFGDVDVEGPNVKVKLR